MGRFKELAVVVLAVSLVSLVLIGHADLALHKPFWLDEGHEIVRTCDQPALMLLTKGAYECSPAPLYWIAQSSVVRSVEPLGLSLRLQYRAVSLTAATLTLLILLLGLRRRLGLAVALVAFSVLLTDPAFHFYAAQNRAYMTWVVITTLLVMTAAEAAVVEQGRSRWGLAALLVAGLLAGLTALPGCLQAAGAFAACAAVRAWLFPGGRLTRRYAALLALGAAAIVGVDVHYWAGSPCRGWQHAKEFGLDFLAGDRSTMIRHALTVLWPEGWSPWVLLGHAALLVGAALPILLWRRRKELTGPERYAAALSLVALTQVLAALPVGMGLAAGRYLFLPRMFIFVMVARVVWIALGFWWLATEAQARVSRFGDRARFLPAAAAAAITLGALWEADRLARRLHLPLAPVSGVPCERLRVPLLRVLEPAARTPDFTPNFLVRLGRALDSCAATPITPQPPRYVVGLESQAEPEWLKVVEQPPDGFKGLRVCDKDVVIESGRARTD
jgi:hypothetical protein